jgi:hypothetical protein
MMRLPCKISLDDRSRSSSPLSHRQDFLEAPSSKADPREVNLRFPSIPHFVPAE